MDCPISLQPQYVNRQAHLPYGLAVDEIEEAVRKTYKFFHGLNSYLGENDLRNIEDMLLANTVSGMVSEIAIKNLSETAKTLMRNERTGGHPDLLPRDYYDSADIHRGEHGIEIKASTKKGGWQGHNKEACWLMLFRYTVTEHSFRFTEILCAELDESDWVFSGRGENSRRTPTASINKAGVEKLRSNFIYRLPGFGVGRHRHILAENYEARDEDSGQAEIRRTEVHVATDLRSIREEDSSAGQDLRSQEGGA